jgi:glycosyltransferase involved in cell wall biosynthesis
MERPVVSTRVGMEGLPLEPGVELEVADDPAVFADRICALLEDPEQGSGMALRAADRIRKTFGWEAVSDRFMEICETACGSVRQGV